MFGRALSFIVLALLFDGCATYRYLPGVQEADRECAIQAGDRAYGGQQRQQTREAVANLALGPILGGLAGPSLEQHKVWQAAHRECMTAHGFPPGTQLREKVQP